MTHDELVQRARLWLVSRGCYPVAVEQRSMLCEESPDALGMSLDGTMLIECKATRTDFCADRRKEFRANGQGMGMRRYYMVPKGLVQPEEVGTWGLIYIVGPTRSKLVKDSEIHIPNHIAETRIFRSMWFMNKGITHVECLPPFAPVTDEHSTLTAH